jgi:hypothetical protein
MGTALPVYVVLTEALLIVAVLLFVYVRRRLGPWPAVMAAALLLFVGPAWQDILWPFEIGFVGSALFGLAMLLALDRGDRRGDLAACAFLAISAGFSSLGLSFLQAYYASISYVEEQIGRVLDALEQGPNADNTIVVFAADNGWHTGEKNHWSKFYLSELACQVVFAISVPGGKPQVCETPVSLLDIYPTLLAQCGLDAPETHKLDGVDLSAILAGRTADRGAPVLSTYGQGCHSIRDARFRYTRYRNGDEELYDHENDPHEWTNLASNPAFAAVKGRLHAHLPDTNAEPIELARGQERDINAWEDEAFQ